MVQLTLKCPVSFNLVVGFLKLGQGGHQRFGDKLPAVVSEAAPLVGKTSLFFNYHPISPVS